MGRTPLVVGIMSLQLAGCAAWFHGGAHPWRLESQGIERLGFIPFHDPVLGAARPELGHAFWEEAASALGAHAGPWVDRPGARLAGSWLRAEGVRAQVEAFVEGAISGYRVQPRQHRVWLSLTVRVLEARSGRLVWSRRLAETVPWEPGMEPASAFAKAARVVAREFVHDLSPSS